MAPALDGAPGEAVGVALAGVDLDRDLVELRCAVGGDALAGAGALRGAGGLPEDHRAPAGPPGVGVGEDDLRAVLARAVQDQVDRRAAAPAMADGDLLEDLGLWRPVVERVAVDAGGGGPAVARLEQDAVLDRQPQQVGQRAVWVGVARDHEAGVGISHGVTQRSREGRAGALSRTPARGVTRRGELYAPPASVNRSTNWRGVGTGGFGSARPVRWRSPEIRQSASVARASVTR